jgi:hypothetical protein
MLIDNNYRNMHARDTRSKGRKEADQENAPGIAWVFFPAHSLG